MQITKDLNKNNSPWNSLSDEALVRIMLTENKKNLYDIIHHRYFEKISRKNHSFLKNKQLAEDFANDILSKAYENLEGYRGKSSFSSWLYSISYNHLIDHMRKKKQLHYPQWNSENELPEIMDESYSDFTEFTYDNLWIILEKIHPEEKALLLMKYRDGLSLKEIASTLFISEDAVKMRLKRSKARVVYLYSQEFGS